MPQLKVIGMEVDKVMNISKALIDDLEALIGCPRDYFSIECVNSTSIMDGRIISGYPIIEIGWFDRGQEIQDLVAKVVTNYVKEQGYSTVDVIFNVFKKTCYYENGEHF